MKRLPKWMTGTPYMITLEIGLVETRFLPLPTLDVRCQYIDLAPQELEGFYKFSLWWPVLLLGATLVGLFVGR